ncbi:hypothetical protein D3C73_1634250 [compost metagenome]
MLRRGLLEDGSKTTAGAAPGSPEVDDQGAVWGDGVLEAVFGEFNNTHFGSLPRNAA